MLTKQALSTQYIVSYLQLKGGNTNI